VAGIATAHRAVGLVDILPGLNEAILAARSLAVSRNASAVLILPADLPSVSAHRLDALVAEARSAAAVGAGVETAGAAAGCASNQRVTPKKTRRPTATISAASPHRGPPDPIG